MSRTTRFLLTKKRQPQEEIIEGQSVASPEPHLLPNLVESEPTFLQTAWNKVKGLFNRDVYR